MQNIGQGVIRELMLSLPPLEEQLQVTDALQTQTSELVTGIAHSERQIDLLHEYRTRLIADVVTGKLDVREAEETGDDGVTEEAEA